MVAYVLWCWVGIHVVVNKKAAFSSAVALGVLRWLVGLFFGVIVFFSFHQDSQESAAAAYFATYTPLRILEWGIILFITYSWLGDKPKSISVPRAVLWISRGILVSFLSDLLSPEGLAGKFCVGRCLC